MRVGRVDEFPVLYACGSKDTSNLCKAAFDAESGAQLQELEHGRALLSVAFSPDGKQVLTGCGDWKARLDKIKEESTASKRKRKR